MAIFTDENSVHISGNVTRDIQVRNTRSGKSVVRFSVAVNRAYTDSNGEEKQIADYVNVQAWGTLAENIGASVFKGSRVVVTGRWSTRSYDGADGEKKYVTDVVADDVALSLKFVKVGALGANPMQEDFQRGGNFSRFGDLSSEDVPF